jgi:hypothetical protein
MHISTIAPILLTSCIKGRAAVGGTACLPRNQTGNCHSMQDLYTHSNEVKGWPCLRPCSSAPPNAMLYFGCWLMQGCKSSSSSMGLLVTRCYDPSAMRHWCYAINQSARAWLSRQAAHPHGTALLGHHMPPGPAPSVPPCANCMLANAAW